MLKKKEGTEGGVWEKKKEGRNARKKESGKVKEK